MVRVEHVMGTVVSLDLRDAGIRADVVDAVFLWFHEVDRRFSTYKDDSEVSQVRGGTQSIVDCSKDLHEVLALCDKVHQESVGAFDAWGLGSGLDPSAVVKGWSVDRAAAILHGAGARNFCLNAGGDIVARGVPEPGRIWRVGIRHPDEADKVAVVINATDCAVATSGAYERGLHIIDPRTGRPASGLLSMTVVGPTLALADAYSTAAYVMGREGVAWILERPGYDAYVITADQRGVYTPGFALLLTPATLDSVSKSSA
jgi:thiamine biosynthesis lipoprotein